MSGRILVTGATGKTGRSLISRLDAAGVPYRAASRTSETPFDWARRETWLPALEGVTGVYLVAPGTVTNPYALMIDFIAEAMRAAPRRFVFLSMSALPAGSPNHGQVHQYLMDNSADWTVLGPTAFMQNFSEGPYAATIRTEDRIYSNTGAGRVPFIDAADIAACAFAALTARQPLNDQFILTSDEAITYDRAAALIGAACGRTITHVPVTSAQMVEKFMARGIPEANARFLALGYDWIAGGGEERTSDAVLRLTGRAPTSFAAFAKAHAGAWEKAPGGGTATSSGL